MAKSSIQRKEARPALASSPPLMSPTQMGPAPPGRTSRKPLSGAAENSTSTLHFFPPARKAGEAPSWTANRFEDDVWEAKSPNPGMGGREAISFKTIPESFRGAIKDFFVALDQTGTLGKRRAKSAGTARQAIAMCKHLTGHLARAGVDRLSMATKNQVEAAYADYCGLLSGKPITTGRAKKYLSVLGQLYAFGPFDRKIIADGLAFDLSSSAFSMGRAKSLKNTTSTPELSEETGRQLMLMALDWVENKSEAVMWVQRAAQELAQAKLAVKNSQKSAAYALKAIRGYVAAHPAFLSELAEAREILGQTPLTSFLDKRKPSSSADDVSDLESDCLAMGLIAQQIQLTLQGFCYVVCAGFNGWRANEILSMEPTALSETPAGYTLRTKVRKTAINPDDGVDRPVPPIVAQSFKTLTRLNAKFVSGKEQASQGAEPASLAPAKEHHPTSGQSLAAHQDAAALLSAKIPSASGSIFRSTSGAPIDTNDMSNRISAAWRQFTGKDERITTHQFRRFFALFYLRRHQGNLDAIRRHFRHVSRDMVWAYVRDGLNAEYLAREKKTLAGEIVRGVVFGANYTSISVGRELKEGRSSLKFLGKTLSIEDAAAYIAKQIDEAYVDLQAMEWGYCLLQRGQAGAACEGRTGPIEARSEPGTCGRCKFLCTGQENVAFWQQTALLHQEVADHPKSTVIMRAESERLLATASSVLARHESNKDKP